MDYTVMWTMGGKTKSVQQPKDDAFRSYISRQRDADEVFVFDPFGLCVGSYRRRSA